MLLRSALRASGALALAFLVSPSSPSAAPPPGLAYDEIVRVVVGATPPPPGAFQADLAAVNAPAVAASATPAPKKRGLGNIGNIAGNIISGRPGDIAGSVAADVANTAISNAMSNAIEQSLGASFSGLAAAARNFLQPHVLHYAYWNGWERIDDPAARTATIRKCDLGQVIKLDLAAKTYAVYDPNAEPSPAPAAPAPPRGRGRSAPADPEAPGTAVATLSEVTKGLTPVRIENYPTTGYDSTMRFATTQSTGSCHDGGASIETIQYLPALNRPAVTSCPIHRAPVPVTASEVVTPPSGGCRPTFNATRSGPTPPSSRLALYSLVLVSGTATPAPAPSGSPAPNAFGFLTERGNLKPLGPADAALFSPPADFTKTP